MLNATEMQYAILLKFIGAPNVGYSPVSLAQSIDSLYMHICLFFLYFVIFQLIYLFHFLAFT